MAQSRDESLPSRIELVVLACLSQSKPPSDAELGEAVQQLVAPGDSAEAARRRATELLAGLVRRAWVIGDDDASRQRKPQTARKLTESGKRALRVGFQLSKAPTWAQVRDKHLPAMALGISPGSERAKKACTETGLTATVLGARYGVHDAYTPMAVCDAVIANLLGMPRGKLTLERMRAHVLLRGVDRSAQDIPAPAPKGYAAKLAAWIASSSVGASENRGTAGSAAAKARTQRKMSTALSRRWVCGEAQPPATGSTDSVTDKNAPPSGVPAQSKTDVRPTLLSSDSAPRTRPAGTFAEPLRAVPPSPPTLPGSAPNLLDVVRDTIPRVGADGRFGEKVYVSAIWHTIERDRKAGDLSLDHFKRWLLRANRDGWIVLARADLIGAMDVKQVNESEINDRGATFHFVLDPRNGASSSQRESHAG